MGTDLTLSNVDLTDNDAMEDIQRDNDNQTTDVVMEEEEDMEEMLQLQRERLDRLRNVIVHGVDVETIKASQSQGKDDILFQTINHIPFQENPCRDPSLTLVMPVVVLILYLFISIAYAIRHIALFDKRPNDVMTSELTNSTIHSLDQDLHILLFESDGHGNKSWLSQHDGFIDMERDKRATVSDVNPKDRYRMQIDPPSWVC